jgi:hypothetical protein
MSIRHFDRLYTLIRDPDFCRHDYGHRYKMISRFIRM